MGFLSFSPGQFLVGELSLCPAVSVLWMVWAAPGGVIEAVPLSHIPLEHGVIYRSHSDADFIVVAKKF